MKKYTQNKKIVTKTKKSKKHQKGGYKCTVDIQQTNKPVVNTGNCNIGGIDCFNKPHSLPQLGILPTSPNLSEVVFDDRYCCGVDKAGSQNGGNNTKLKDGMISIKNILGINKNINFYVSNGRFSTEGLTKKEAKYIQKILKTKNINAKMTNYALGGVKLYFESSKLHSEAMKNKKFNQYGGNGYYLSLDNCPPGGLSTVKGYDSCCPPVFSGKLTGNTNNYIYNPFQNQYYVPALQQNIQVKNTTGGNQKTKKNKKKGGYTTLGFKTYPSYCDGKENWSQCGTTSSACSVSGGKNKK